MEIFIWIVSGAILVLVWWLCVLCKYEDSQGRIWVKGYRQFRFHLNQKHLWYK